MQSIFAFLCDVYDELIFYPEKEFDKNSAKISGIENNLVIEAWKILREHFDYKIPHLEIKKNIPICGGLGGGSSDAACFINSVFDFWKFSQVKKLSHIGIFHSLGADTRVFLFKYFTNCRFVYLNGTGLSGEIRKINLPVRNQHILIINDETKLLTSDVFRNFKEPFGKEVKKPASMLEKFHNSLQTSALELAPQLRLILHDLSKLSPPIYGVSGSGATCFAVVEDIPPRFMELPYPFKAVSLF